MVPTHRPISPRKAISQLALLGAIFGLGACSAQDSADPLAGSMTNAQVRAQQLGESTRPVWFSGQNESVLPTYDDRVILHFYNRIRITPQNWPLTDNMGNRLLVSGEPPALYQPFMSETGRWQANHNLQTGCNCDAMTVGYDPMNPETSELEKYVNASCCEIGITEGVAQCVGPIVPCTDNRATLRTKRWALLNQGAGSISSENVQSAEGSFPPSIEIVQGFIDQNQLASIATGATNKRANAIGISQSKDRKPPEECMMGKENPCGDGGVCKEQGSGALVCDQGTNPDCLGLCEGPNDGKPCKLPDTEPGMDPCDEENWPVYSQFAFSTGTTIEPAPALTDGIHYQWTEESIFDQTQMGEVAYAVNYYEPSGEPVGTPSEIKLVQGGTCHELTQLPVNAMLADGNPAPYAGSTFKVALPATKGCFPYVFVAKDAAGLEYSYPEYGSLQAQLDDMGAVVPNDETCPIWVPTRVDLSCVSPANECANNQTRSCYTGRAGTQDNGICKLGTETCNNGRWSGFCDGEVTPEAVDTCGDGKDNNCNGGTDEGCEQTSTPDMGQPDMNTTPDMGQTEEDMGGIIVTPPADKDEDEGCGCTQLNNQRKLPAAPALILSIFGFVGVLLRRRK